MTLAGFALALVLGALMGLLGGGGSVVAVPAFTLLLGLPPKDAVVASLVVVGLASAAGAVSAWVRGVLPPATAAIVGASAILGSLVGSRVGARLPDNTQLAILGIVMFGAAAAMWLRSAPAPASPSPLDIPVLAIIGVTVGTVTGLVGVGGGFLIVPALVVGARQPLPQAAAASLFVIALSAAAALPGYAGHLQLPWTSIAPLAATAAATALIAGPLAPRLPQRPLQRAFAVVLVIIGSYLFLEA